MKKIILPVIALGCALLTGCSEFLNVSPENSYTVDTFFSSDQQAIDATDNLYLSYSNEAMYSQDIHADVCICTNMMVAVRSSRGMYINNYKLESTGDDGCMPEIYETIYSIMAKSNWLVQSLLNKEQKEGELSAIMNRCLGEAYFNRAFSHLISAARYGCKEQGVPFVAYETVEGGYNYTIPPQQASVLDNFELIIKDLEAAYERLPKISEYAQADLGRPQKEACLAMEARVYSYWATWDKSKWDDVIRVVDQLESMGRKLTDDYALNFSGEPEDFFTSEYCWGLPCLSTGKSGGIWFNEILMPTTLAPQLDGWGEYTTTKDMYNDFIADGPDNDRLARNIMKAGDVVTLFGKEETIQPQYGEAFTTGYFVYKYCDALKHADGTNKYYSSAGQSNMMFHFIRFADCLLLRAEANLAKGNAAQATVDINTVRTRSHCPAIATATWADIYHERRVELCFEGMDYYYEVKRWAVGGAAEIKALAINELEGHPHISDWQKDADGNWYDNGEIEYPVWNFEKHWADYKIALPYPSTPIINSAGQLKQNPGY